MRNEEVALALELNGESRRSFCETYVCLSYETKPENAGSAVVAP